MSSSPGGKCKKRDTRKSPQNLAYKSEHRHEKSHIKKIIRHLSRYKGRDNRAIRVLRDHAQRSGSSAVRHVESFLELNAACASAS